MLLVPRRRNSPQEIRCNEYFRRALSPKNFCQNLLNLGSPNRCARRPHCLGPASRRDLPAPIRTRMEITLFAADRTTENLSWDYRAHLRGTPAIRGA